MSIDKVTEFAGAAPASDKNTNDLDLSRGFPSRLHPARQWFNYLFNLLTRKTNEIIDGKLDINANAVSASKLQTSRVVSFNGDATGSFSYDGSQNSSSTLTLANSGVEANTYGGAFKIPVITVNSKGLLTVVSTQDIQNASTTQKGVVKIGENLTIDAQGVLSANTPYSLPTASDAQLGGVRIGSNINIVNGVISVPRATAAGYGVLKVGTGLDIDSGVISSAAVGSADQSYVDVTGSRAGGMPYTNDTDKTIWVSVSIIDMGVDGALKARVGTVDVVDLVDIGFPTQISFFVAPGATYSVTLTTNTIRRWVEFR